MRLTTSSATTFDISAHRCALPFVGRSLWSDVDLRKLNFSEYHERITVRLPFGDREKLRRVAAELGVPESDIVREGINVVIEAILGETRPASQLPNRL